MRFTGVLFLLAAMTIAVAAQRPRTIDTSDKTDPPRTASTPVPQTVKAKYEGGVFGYNKPMDGSLTFDDTNRRLLFRNKQQKEIFIPYDAVTSAFADTQKRQPKAASIAGAVPLIYAFPAHFIKTKVRYLTVQFSDQDTRMAGITSFRLENKETVASFLRALSEKAGLTARGEIYIKKKDADSDNATP